MFQVVAIVCLVGAVAAGVVHYLAAGRKAPPRPRGRRHGRWEMLVYAVLTLSLSVLTVTGFYPALRGEAVRGWLLMIHVTFGGVFAAALAAAAVTWAERSAFGRAGRFDPVRKVCFWVALPAGLATILTMTISMLPLCSPDELEALLEVHRYSALMLVLVMMADSYRAGLGGRAGRREDQE